MRTQGKTALMCALLGLAAAGLSGCASASAVAAHGEDVPASYEPSTAQVDALADGVVSRVEYLSAFGNYRTCMANGGFPVTVLNDESTIIDLRVPAAAVESGVDDRCYQIEFMPVNEAWQLANQDQRADNSLLEECLSDRSLSVPETRQEKVDALLEAGVDLSSCLIEE